MRVTRRILVLTGVVALTSPAVAYARGGGGSHGFSGGGSGSGSGGSFHGSGGGIGGSGSGSAGIGFIHGFGGFGWYILAAAIVAVLCFAVWLKYPDWKAGWKARRGASSNTRSDRAAHRADAQAHQRAAQVEARVEALADDDATFDPTALQQRAVWLYTTAQRAWTDRDHATLRQILSPVLYGKWADELRDYASRGEVNVVEIESGPEVELVDVANREGESRDTVTFRITATLNDYVRREYGANAERVDGSTRPVEYWTLRKNEAGTWIVATVEQADEGAHHLTDAIETDGWDQKAVAREAVLEVAGKTATAGVDDILSLTGISWSTDADAAATDISLLDARFDKAVLEIAVEQFLEQWIMEDGSLDFTPVRTSNRTVMRDADVSSIEVSTLVSREPIVFRVTVAAEGLYYEVDRRTEEVLRGDAHKRRPITFEFDLQLDQESSNTKGWTVIAADVRKAGSRTALHGV